MIRLTDTAQLAPAVADLRTRAGLTQEQLAHAADGSQE